MYDRVIFAELSIIRAGVIAFGVWSSVFALSERSDFTRRFNSNRKRDAPQQPTSHRSLFTQWAPSQFLLGYWASKHLGLGLARRHGSHGSVDPLLSGVCLFRFAQPAVSILITSHFNNFWR